MKTTKEVYFSDNDKETKDKFYFIAKNGKKWLTKYALRCGCRDVQGRKFGTFFIEDSMGCCYFVKGHASDNVYNAGIWETFDTLTEARKFIYSRKLEELCKEKAGKI